MLPSSMVTFLSQSRLPRFSLSNQYINREVLKFPSWLGQEFQTMDLGFPPFQAGYEGLDVPASAYVCITTVRRT